MDTFTGVLQYLQSRTSSDIKTAKNEVLQNGLRVRKYYCTAILDQQISLLSSHASGACPSAL